MSDVRNNTGASIMAMSRASIVLIAAVTRTDSVAAVGQVTSDFLSFSLILSVCDGAAFYFSA